MTRTPAAGRVSWCAGRAAPESTGAGRGFGDAGGRSRRVPGAPVPADASADDPDVLRLGSLLALGDVELHLLPFLKAAVAATGDRAEVHEHVRTALDRDEAVALVAVEPLHRALRHLDLLRAETRHPGA